MWVPVEEGQINGHAGAEFTSGGALFVNDSRIWTLRVLEGNKGTFWFSNFDIAAQQWRPYSCWKQKPKVSFSAVRVVVGWIAGARQYLLAGLSCTVIKIQLVVSDKMLTTPMGFHLLGNKIHQEVFRIYLENLHEIRNF